MCWRQKHPSPPHSYANTELHQSIHDWILDVVYMSGFRLFAPFVMNIEVVLSGLDCTLCFCSSCHMMICRCINMSFLFSFNQSCLYIKCDMIYAIHRNKITFIVIVIETSGFVSLSHQQRQLISCGFAMYIWGSVWTYSKRSVQALPHIYIATESDVHCVAS